MTQAASSIPEVRPSAPRNYGVLHSGGKFYVAPTTYDGEEYDDRTRILGLSSARKELMGSFETQEEADNAAYRLASRSRAKFGLPALEQPRTMEQLVEHGVAQSFQERLHRSRSYWVDKPEDVSREDWVDIQNAHGAGLDELDVPYRPEEVERERDVAVRARLEELKFVDFKLEASRIREEYNLPPMSDEDFEEAYATQERAQELVQYNEVRRGLGMKPVPIKEMETAVGFLEGMGDVAGPYGVGHIPFLGGAAETYSLLNVVYAAKAVNEGTATDEQTKLLNEWWLESQLEAIRGGTWGQTVGGIIGQLPAFGLEIWATSGTYTAGRKAGRAVAIKTINDAVERIGGKTARGALQKHAAGRLSRRALVSVTGGVRGAAEQATFAGALSGRLSASSLRNIIPEMELSEDELGQLALTIEGTDMSAASAIFRGLTDQLIEYGSERMGWMTGRAGLGKLIGKVPRADQVNAWKAVIAKRWLSGGAGRTVKGFDDSLKKMGWNGVIGEMFEERVGELARVPVDAMTLEEWEYALPDFEQLSAEFVAFLVPGGFNMAAANVKEIGNYKEARKQGSEYIERRTKQLQSQVEAAGQAEAEAEVAEEPQWVENIGEQVDPTGGQVEEDAPMGRARFIGPEGVIYGEVEYASEDADLVRVEMDEMLAKEAGVPEGVRVEYEDVVQELEPVEAEAPAEVAEAEVEVEAEEVEPGEPGEQRTMFAPPAAGVAEAEVAEAPAEAEAPAVAEAVAPEVYEPGEPAVQEQLDSVAAEMDRADERDVQHRIRPVPEERQSEETKVLSETMARTGVRVVPVDITTETGEAPSRGGFVGADPRTVFVQEVPAGATSEQAQEILAGNVQAIVMHEVTHTLESENPGLFNALINLMPAQVKRGVEDYRAREEDQGGTEIGEAERGKDYVKLVSEGLAMVFQAASESGSILMTDPASRGVWEQLKAWVRRMAVRLRIPGQQNQWVQTVVDQILEGKDISEITLPGQEKVLARARRRGLAPQEGAVAPAAAAEAAPRFAPAPAENTPEFRRWFKDSKVVDEQGKPLVVYHGTAIPGVTNFETYGTPYGLMGTGTYFTDSPGVASGYATSGAKKASKRGYEPSPNVIPAHLSIQNPFDMDGVADLESWIESAERTGEEDLARELLELKPGVTNEKALRAVEVGLENAEVYGYEGAETVRSMIENMGHDGITHIGGGHALEGPAHRVYIAFEPTQIKSVTGNVGTFDPAQADIRYAPKPETPEQRAERLARQAEQRKRDEAAVIAGAPITSAARQRAARRVIKKGEDEARKEGRAAPTKAAALKAAGAKIAEVRERLKKKMLSVKEAQKMLADEVRKIITPDMAKWAGYQDINALIREVRDATPRTLMAKIKKVELKAAELSWKEARGEAKKAPGKKVSQRIAEIPETVPTKADVETKEENDERGLRQRAKDALEKLRSEIEGNKVANLREKGSKPLTMDEYEAREFALREATNQFKAAMAEGTREQKEIVLQRRMKQNEVSGEVAEEIESASTSEIETEKKRTPFLKRMFYLQLDQTTIIQRITRKFDNSSVLYSLMVTALRRAENSYNKRLREVIELANEAAIRAGYSSLSDALVKTSGTQGTHLVEKIDLVLGGKTYRGRPLGEALHLVLLDPETRKKVIEGNPLSFHSDPVSRIENVTAEELDAIRDQLSPEQVEFGEAMKDILEAEIRPTMFDAIRRIRGFEPETVFGYWPISRRMSEAKQQDPNAFLDGNEGIASQLNRYIDNSTQTKERTKDTTNPIRVIPAATTFVEQVDTGLRISEMAETLRLADSVLRSDAVRDAILRKHGVDVYKDFRRVILEASGTQAQYSGPDKILGAVTSNVAQSLLITNIRTWVLQLTGIPRLLGTAFNPAELAAGAVWAGKNFGSAKAQVADASGYAWRRWSKSAADRYGPQRYSQLVPLDGNQFGVNAVNAAKNLMKLKLSDAYKSWTTASEAIKILDAFDGVSFGIAFGAAKYRLRDQGLTEEELNEAAGELASDAIRNTQNSTSALDLSLGARAMKESAFFRLMYMFSSDPLKLANVLTQSVQMMKNGDRAKGGQMFVGFLVSSATAIAWRGVWTAGFGAAMAAVGGDDDDRKAAERAEKTEQAIYISIVRELAGLSFFGPIVETIGGTVVPDYPGGDIIDNPVSSVINSSVYTAKKAYEAFSQLEDFEQDQAVETAAIAATKAVNELLGVFAGNPFRAIANDALKLAEAGMVYDPTSDLRALERYYKEIPPKDLTPEQRKYFGRVRGYMTEIRKIDRMISERTKVYERLLQTGQDDRIERARQALQRLRDRRSELAAKALGKISTSGG